MGQQRQRLQNTKDDYRAVASPSKQKARARDMKAAKEARIPFARLESLVFILVFDSPPAR
jgi:hypothetical protein